MLPIFRKENNTSLLVLCLEWFVLFEYETFVYQWKRAVKVSKYTLVWGYSGVEYAKTFNHLEHVTCGFHLFTINTKRIKWNIG